MNMNMNLKQWKTNPNLHSRLALALLFAMACLLPIGACSSGGGGGGGSAAPADSYVCPNGTAVQGRAPAANTEKCEACDPSYVLTLGETCVTAPTTIVLFSVGQEDGDFGFDRCQDLLERTDAPSTDGERIASALADAGYRKAVFFGSTPDYNFSNIDTNANALGLQMGFTTNATNAFNEDGAGIKL